ncbi:MAG: hypothetical protein FJ291_33340 [Planctomycetes bacterium]|nr:hypothetical protein [Planctomycetota bacterium]
MNAWKPLPPPRLLAALAALALPLLAGCATGALVVFTRRYHAVGDVVAAYARADELAIAYAVGGPGGHTRVAWFTGSVLRGRDASVTAWDMIFGSPVWPERNQGLPSRPPEGVQHVGVVRLGPDQQEPPPLTAGAQMQVCAWPPAVPPRNPFGRLVLVLLRTDKGAVVQRRVWLPSYQDNPWWVYAALPVTLAVDVVTLPLQLSVALIVENLRGDGG